MESTNKTTNDNFKVGLIPWYLDIVYLSQLYGISKSQIENLSHEADFLKISGAFPLSNNNDISEEEVMQVIMSDYNIPDYDTLAKKKQPYTLFSKKLRNIDYTNKAYIKARMKEIQKGISKQNSTINEPPITSVRKSFSKPDFILSHRISTNLTKKYI